MKKIFAILIGLTASVLSTESGFESKEVARRTQTLNNMGSEHFGIDPYSQAYIDACHKLSDPVLEIGAGYGHVSAEALKNDAQNVFVNDLCADHLAVFFENLASNHKPYAHLIPGSFPQITRSLPDSFFQYIFASRVFHFFSPLELEAAIQEIYRLLKLGGKIIIVAETAYLKKSSPHLIGEYEKRKAEGMYYPGYFPDVKSQFPGLITYGPDILHCLDPDILRKLFTVAGFEVKLCQYINRGDYPEHLRLDGRESVGLIAQKPM